MRPFPIATCVSVVAPAALLVCGLWLSGCGGSSPRPAGDPDFRALQLHEARVTELAATAEDDARSCAERLRAAGACPGEVTRAEEDLAGVADADATARVERLARLCSAAAATAEGQCGPDA